MLMDPIFCLIVWDLFIHLYSLTVFTFAYVSCDDVYSLKEFEGQNVVAIKAPRHTRLEVADPHDVSG
jgi:E2F transcription factor CC-MB domain